MSHGKGRKEMSWTAYHELLLRVRLFWKEANRLLKYMKNRIVNNTENVFFIVTDISCFRLVSYQRKHTGKIGWVKTDKSKLLVWEKNLYFKDWKIIMLND